MDGLLNFISEDLIYALGWTVMHSLWQGFLIAIIMAFAFQVFGKKSAKIRYEISTLSLFMVLVSSVCTFIFYYGSAGDMIEQQITLVGQALPTSQVVENSTIQSFTQSCVTYFNDHLPLIVLLWMIGASFFILRLFGGLAYIQRLKHQRITLLPDYWQVKVQVLISKIPTKKVVQIFESASVRVPMVIGYFKPYILLPVGAINQLDEKEVEAIIAHELAHVFRNDFLLNILLSFIEVFFYYHPAVWWISGNIRLERENCCDDIAISVCGNSLTYAKALVRLQELNAYAPTFAMPFSGQKNQLLNRIKRILNQPQNRSNIMERLTATCFLLLAILFISASPNHLIIEEEEVNVFEVVEGNEIEIETLSSLDVLKILDTIPEEKKILKGKILEITRKDGEISEVILDGREVSKEEFEQYDHIETDGKIIVKGDDLPDLSSDILLSPFDEDRIRPTVENRVIISELKRKRAAERFQNALAKREQQQTITKKKNKDGQTLIIVETVGREPVEIVVDGQEDIIFVEGTELQDGDTAVIIDERSFQFEQFKFSTPDLEKFQFDTEHSGKTLLSDEDKVISYFNGEAFSDKDFELMNKERLEKEETIAFLGLEKQREKEAIYLLKKEFEHKKSLERKEGKLKKKHWELAEIRLNQEEHRKLFETLEREKLGLFSGVPSQTVQQISAELKRDGLIDDENNFSFLLSENRLKVNKKKQPKAIFKKYKKLYEQLTGSKLKKKSKYQINISGN